MGDLVSDIVEPRVPGGFSAHHDDGKVIQSVGVAFPEFVHPDDGGVVEHVTVLTGFGGLFELFGEVGELLREPDVDFFELLLGPFVFVRLVA